MRHAILSIWHCIWPPMSQPGRPAPGLSSMGAYRQTIFNLPCYPMDRALCDGRRNVRKQSAYSYRQERIDRIMDISTIKQLIADGKIEYIKVGAPDIEGVYRGKRVASRFFLESLESGFAQCDVLFGWDIAENVLPNLTFSNWARGFADIVMKPDLATFALVPWEENVASGICELW